MIAILVIITLSHVKQYEWFQHWPLWNSASIVQQSEKMTLQKHQLRNLSDKVTVSRNYPSPEPLCLITPTFPSRCFCSYTQFILKRWYQALYCYLFHPKIFRMKWQVNSQHTKLPASTIPFYPFFNLLFPEIVKIS